eukprot:g15035.t1
MRSVLEAVLAPVSFVGRRHVVDDCAATDNGLLRGINGASAATAPSASQSSYYTQCGERPGPSPRFLPTDRSVNGFLKKVNGSLIEFDRSSALALADGAVPKRTFNLKKRVGPTAAEHYYHHNPAEYYARLRDMAGRGGNGGRHLDYYPEDQSLEMPMIAVDEMSPTIAETDLIGTLLCC